jgi:hypothetical protein
MGRSFLVILVLAIGVSQLLLKVSALERVSYGFGFAVILLGTVAALNWLAWKYRWGFLWVLPDWRWALRISPDVWVAAGFAFGFAFGIWKWI